MDSLLLHVFVKLINDKRKTKTWYTFEGIVEGKKVRIKGYKTWLQYYHVDGINYGNEMERKVKDFNEDLEKPFGKG